MRYVSIDLETTGLDPDKDDIVEFGAVIDDLEHPKPVEQLPRFHAYVLPHRVDPQYKHLAPAAQVKHARYHGDPYALSMHPTIFRRIAKREAGYNYYEPDVLLNFFNAWLSNHGLTEKIVFAGKNFASFDLQFLKKIPNWYIFDRNHRTFDPTPLFFKLGEDKVPPSMGVCLKRAGFPHDVVHTAVEDAISVIRLIRHGILVKEPADYDSIPDEPQQKVEKKAPFAETPKGVRGCSIVVGVESGKLSPKVIPAKGGGEYLTPYCREKGCTELKLNDSVFCQKHEKKFLNSVVRNSPLAKQHG